MSDQSLEERLAAFVDDAKYTALVELDDERETAGRMSGIDIEAGRALAVEVGELEHYITDVHCDHHATAAREGRDLFDGDDCQVCDAATAEARIEALEGALREIEKEAKVRSGSNFTRARNSIVWINNRARAALNPEDTND